MKRKNAKPKSIKNILNKLLDKLDIKKGILQGRAFILWEDVVGEMSSKNTTPLKIENGRMFVTTKNCVWRQELFCQKNEIIKKLNLRLGSNFIKDIIFL